MQYNICAIGIFLVLTNLFFIFIKPTNKILKFKNTLLPEQLTKYKENYTQRLMIYIYATILGISLGLLYIYINKNVKYQLCKFIVISITIQYLFYYFYPKNKSIMYYLDSNKQISLWADVSTEFSKSWKYSLILSVVSYCIIYKSLI